MYIHILLFQQVIQEDSGCFLHWTGWMFLSFALGIGLGKWLWSKDQRILQRKVNFINDLKVKNTNLEKKYSNLKFKITEIKKDNAGLKAALTHCEENKIALSNQLENSYKETSKIQQTNIISPAKKTSNIEAIEKIEESKKAIPFDRKKFLDSINIKEHLKSDNLQIIAGIGPKVEQVLKRHSYDNWEDLSKANYKELVLLLHDAGPRFRIHNPKNWSQQATLAVEGKWKALINFQESLETKHHSDDTYKKLSKIEKLLAEQLGVSMFTPDNLKIIKGIDTNTEKLLKAAGISNWTDLSISSPKQLQKIMEEASCNNTSDVSTWSIQAKIALKNEWSRLKEYQDFL